MADWFYFDNDNQRLGPYSGKQILQLAKSGIITAETLVEDPNGRTCPAKKLIRKPALPTPPSSVSSDEANPFTASMPTGPNPFTAPMPVVNQTPPKASAPVAEGKKSAFPVILILATVAVIGFAVTGTLAYQFRGELFGKPSPSLPPGKRDVVVIPGSDPGGSEEPFPPPVPEPEPVPPVPPKPPVPPVPPPQPPIVPQPPVVKDPPKPVNDLDKLRGKTHRRGAFEFTHSGVTISQDTIDVSFGNYITDEEDMIDGKITIIGKSGGLERIFRAKRSKSTLYPVYGIINNNDLPFKDLKGLIELEFGKKKPSQYDRNYLSAAFALIQEHHYIHIRFSDLNEMEFYLGPSDQPTNLIRVEFPGQSGGYYSPGPPSYGGYY